MGIRRRGKQWEDYVSDREDEDAGEESESSIASRDVDPRSGNHTPRPSTSAYFNKHADETKGHKQHGKKKKQHSWSWASSKRFVFIAGILMGIGITWYTAQSNDLVSLDSLSEISLDSLVDEFRDMLPIGVVKEARDLEKQHPQLSDSFAVGDHLSELGMGPKHPIILVPGVISTGLEVFSTRGTEECPSRHYFRKRLWGSWYMLRAMLLNKDCWLKHLKLDEQTGLDPEGFKLRAAQGMEAADFFVPGYWIWNKILENLAALGYDINNMNVAAYDWRLGYPDLERRDGYFSKLKRLIESFKKTSGEKVVLTGHSMGSQVIFYFFKWAEAEGEGFGNGGANWVNEHVEAFVDISGSTLGTPKAIVALLSGEMKDTVQLNALAVYGLEQFFSRRERADLLRSWSGIVSMLPKGGEEVWGSLSKAPDDTRGQETSFGNFIRFKDKLSNLSSRNLTISESIDYLYAQAPEWFRNRAEKSYSNGIAKTRKQVEENNKNPSKWVNPLEVALPNAPDMKIYCFYGVGKPTERSYYYQEETEKDVSKLNVSISHNDPDAVVLGEGDGTISLVTHTMCHRWKDRKSKFNPGGAKVTVVEMLHQPDRLDIRGGAKTAEHVDILGRTELNELLLRVVAGRGHEIEEKRESNIDDWVWDLDLGE